MNNATRSRGIATAAASLAMLTVVALSAPATAAAYDGDPAGGSARPPANSSAYLKFTKNWKHPDRSTLSLVKGGHVVKSYRAGSGLGSTNDCLSNRGWLPSGTYQVKGHQTSRDSTVKGYAIQLSNKECHPKSGKKKDAVTRDDLFIHSEMTKNGGRGSTEPTRWDGDSDYKSYGCIKLRPDHIKDLFSRLKNDWPNLTLRVG
ncbi:L,D-transpeptidase [Streptomyces sp. NPDC060232]|uniref:L,D-transpeptidase n=1 Tax=Streptomyces sp. NPDC060232 TaxID=3347079 RepID=UPI0036478AD8